MVSMQICARVSDRWPGCKMVTRSARHTESNGGIERFNMTIQLKVLLYPRFWLFNMQLLHYVICLVWSCVCHADAFVAWREWQHQLASRSQNIYLPLQYLALFRHKKVGVLHYLPFPPKSQSFSYCNAYAGFLRGCIWASTENWYSCCHDFPRDEQ